jgi:hypothetical protein
MPSGRGLSGHGGHATIIPRKPSDPNIPEDSALFEGNAGSYHVLFHLQRPGIAIFSERHFSLDDPHEGNSHIKHAKPPAILEIRTQAAETVITFIVYPNQAGHLGRIETSLEASSFDDARRRAFGFLTPMLSDWSVTFDVPVMIARIQVREIATDSRRMYFTYPFDEIDLSSTRTGAGEMSGDLRALASYYREALNSASSPAYQFLCLFKIIEGVRNRRKREVRKRLRTGLAPRQIPEERVPSDERQFIPWLERIFPHRSGTWSGLAVTTIFQAQARGQLVEDLIRPTVGRTPGGPLYELRNDVAHGLMPGREPLTADQALHIERVVGWLPLTRCLARLMMVNELHRESSPASPASPPAVRPV